MQSIQHDLITISQTINCFTRLKQRANAILSRECTVEQDPYNKVWIGWLSTQAGLFPLLLTIEVNL